MIRLYMFLAICAHYQGVKIVLHSIWYHHTCRWPSRAPVHGTTIKDNTLHPFLLLRPSCVHGKLEANKKGVNQNYIPIKIME